MGNELAITYRTAAPSEYARVRSRPFSRRRYSTAPQRGQRALPPGGTGTSRWSRSQSWQACSVDACMTRTIARVGREGHRYFVRPEAARDLSIGLRGSRYRLLPVASRKDLLEVLDLGQIVDDDIRVRRMPEQEILMVGLGGVEGAQCVHPSDDGPGERLTLLELGDVGLRDPPLRFVGVEDAGSILAANIGSLAVELCGIVHDREVDLEHLTIRQLLRIEADLHRLGMPGPAPAHHLVAGRLPRSARVAGQRALDTA